LSGNAFLNNKTQVKYVGTRHIEWSRDGRGNFWSDSLAFDLNDDGVADAPYHPNDLVDQIIWRHPLAKLLLNAPATQVLRWSQRAFPNIRPGGVVDSHPLMAPPKPQNAAANKAQSS
jgi:nitrous oxidase accessory protein